MQTSPVSCVAFVLAALSTGGCSPSSVGRACVNPNGDAPSGTQLSSAALECDSRLCLIQQLSTADTSEESCPGGRCTCTASCDSDSDCTAETTAYCTTGFVCAVATDVGPFCCKKLCVCRDDLDATNSTGNGASRKVVTPFACDPSATGSIVTCDNVSH